MKIWFFQPWVRWVGFRYLLSKKSSKFLSFITILSVFGVALGVAAMIVVLSVMDGFEDELKKRLMSTELHVLIEPTKQVPGFKGGFVPAESVENSGVMNQLRSNPMIESVIPVLATEAILRSGTRVGGVMLRGVNHQRIIQLKKKLVEIGEDSVLKAEDGSRLPGLYVGKELAYLMDLIPGDRVSLISPTETEGPLEAIPRLKRFVVQAIYQTGHHDQEIETVFTPIKNVESFIRKRGVISQWELIVKDFENAPAIANQIRKQIPEFRVKDWMQMNSTLFSSLKLERIAMFFVMVFTVIVASFNIVTTLTLMVLEKKREISILKAMGARRNHIASIFLWEGLIIGGSGVGLGIVIGAIVCWILKTKDFIELPDIYLDRTLPVSFVPGYYVLIGLSAFFIVLIACLYPAKRAARLHPLEGIRLG